MNHSQKRINPQNNASQHAKTCNKLKYVVKTENYNETSESMFAKQIVKLNTKKLKSSSQYKELHQSKTTTITSRSIPLQLSTTTLILTI